MPTREEARAATRARIEELERRVLDGTDDRAYCLRWIRLHTLMQDWADSTPDGHA